MEFIREWLTPTVSWFLAGVILLLIELLSPGLIFLFFSLAAFMVSLLTISDAFAANMMLQFLTFSIISVASLLLMRNKLKSIFYGKESNDSVEVDDDYLGKKVKVTKAISKSKDGKVMIHGTNWNATSLEDFNVGDMVVVTKKENLTLHVKSI